MWPEEYKDYEVDKPLIENQSALATGSLDAKCMNLMAGATPFMSLSKREKKEPFH